MTRRRSHQILATQPTCRRRPSTTTCRLNTGPLEITHACRLRRKLAEHGARAVVNVWGIGYRLAPLDQQRAQGRAA
jgi:hypothetical protein